MGEFEISAGKEFYHQEKKSSQCPQKHTSPYFRNHKKLLQKNYALQPNQIFFAHSSSLFSVLLRLQFQQTLSQCCFSQSLFFARFLGNFGPRRIGYFCGRYEAQGFACLPFVGIIHCIFRHRGKIFFTLFSILHSSQISGEFVAF